MRGKKIEFIVVIVLGRAKEATKLEQYTIPIYIYTSENNELNYAWISAELSRFS